jgi:DNA-binding response OmpR family regulator
MTMILSVGNDPSLLRTRNEILFSSGYSVVLAYSEAEAINNFLNGDFDLVILCHSIPHQEKRLIVASMRHHSPYTPIMLLASGMADACDFGDRNVDASPESLLAAIPEMLRRSAESVRKDQTKAS